METSVGALFLLIVDGIVGCFGGRHIKAIGASNGKAIRIRAVGCRTIDAACHPPFQVANWVNDARAKVAVCRVGSHWGVVTDSAAFGCIARIVEHWNYIYI